MSKHTYQTSVEIEIDYNYDKGYRGSFDEPPEGPAADVVGVYLIDAGGHRVAGHTPIPINWLAQVLGVGTEDRLIRHASEENIDDHDRAVENRRDLREDR